MARIYHPYERALDNNGKPMPFAQLYTRDAASPTTPKETWSDVGLTTPNPNPIQADQYGFFPAAFASEGEAYYLILVPNGGNPAAPFHSADGVDALGSDVAADLARTFAAARMLISGGLTDGVHQGVIIAAGLPSPTATGGYMSLEGWAGTQLDRLDLKAATANVLGRLKENDKKLQGVVYAENQAFAGVSAVIIPLPNDPVGARACLIDIIDFHIPDILKITLSYDGGATFKSGATDYQSVVTTGGAGLISASDLLAASAAQISSNAIYSANKPARMWLDVETPNAGTDATIIQTKLIGWNGTPKPIIEHGAAFGLGGYGRATHLKITPNTGTISGVWRSMVQRGLGET
ncbi:MAG TPA: hypothetical protein VFH92_11390 [Phenylobacterium sp.]|nr:hypothetical protein [Phenylobacterium sp.]